MPIDYGKRNVVAPAGEIATREKVVAMMKGRFFEFRGVLIELRKMAGSLVVENDQALSSAVEVAGQVRRLMRDIETRRKDVTAPLLDDKREVDGFATTLKGDCQLIISSIDKITSPYLLEKEKIRKKAEAEQQKRFEAERERMLSEAAQKAEIGNAEPVGNIEQVPAPVLFPEIVPSETRVETASGTVTVKTEKYPEIVNLAAVCGDPEFIKARSRWLGDQALIYARQCLKMGRLNVPGVVFRDVPVAKSRLKR